MHDPAAGNGRSLCGFGEHPLEVPGLGWINPPRSCLGTLVCVTWENQQTGLATLLQKSREGSPNSTGVGKDQPTPARRWLMLFRSVLHLHMPLRPPYHFIEPIVAACRHSTEQRFLARPLEA